MFRINGREIHLKMNDDKVSKCKTVKLGIEVIPLIAN